jgi:hypothetical protein
MSVSASKLRMGKLTSLCSIGMTVIPPSALSVHCCAGWAHAAASYVAALCFSVSLMVSEAFILMIHW